MLLSDVKVVTIAASFKTEGTLNLSNVVRYYGGQYEPELFPAAMFSKDSIQFTCFHTGSVLVTGIKSNLRLLSRTKAYVFFSSCS